MALVSFRRAGALTSLGIVMLAMLLAPVAVADDTTDQSLEFKDRRIDLQPHIEGFPYRGFRPFYDAGKLYYYHQDETTMLKELDLDGDVDLRNGRVVSDVDFATRNVWGIRYRQSDGRLYWTGDEINDEVINLYALDPRTKAIEKLTDVPYIFGWRWDEDARRVAYVARLGHKEQRLGELWVLDLETGKNEKVVADTPGYRMTWTSPSWRPDGTGIVLTVLKDADRAHGNIAYVDLATGEMRIVTDPTHKRNWPSPHREWLTNDEFLYFSNEDGYRNVFRFNVNTRQNEQVTRFSRDIGDAELVEVDGRKYLFTVLSNPIENEIVVVEPKTGEVVHREKVDVNLSILDTAADRLLASSTSGTVKFRIDEITVGTSGLEFATRVDVPADLKHRIVHATVERVEFPTFDTDPATGEPRKLHAFLYKPKNPLPSDQAIVMIQSFYGGGNTFSTRTQILAEAGIYVFSPSPRGSRGFGREFAALNDKDLGGNEIIDVIYAARYVSEKLGIPPERVGVYGGSHGGYATMRLLTFPGHINGTQADFAWGFGMSHAGFSDIVHFYESCNIPDWVTLEAGDPATEAEKLRDRSPLYHADKMKGKLLLTHGTNDSRVPIEGSRWMADSLRTYDKDVTLIEFEGQGHGIKGLDNNRRFYRVWFDFLESLDG